MRQIRVAAQIHPQHGAYPEIRSAVRAADEMGYDVVYTWDHFFPLYGDPDGAHFECWTLLGAFADSTSSAEIGPLVTAISYRNPELVADMARTIDHISGGRAVLGIGAGWFQRDYLEYGYQYGTAGSRIDDLATALPRIIRRWERLVPPPLRTIPIVIGGVGEQKTLRLVAEHATGWHALFPDRPEQLEPKVEALLGWCDRLGRDPGRIEWGVGVEPDDLDRFLADDAPVYLEMGFTQFTLGFNGPHWSVSAGEPWLRWRDEANRSR